MIDHQWTFLYEAESWEMKKGQDKAHVTQWMFKQQEGIEYYITENLPVAPIEENILGIVSKMVSSSANKTKTSATWRTEVLQGQKQVA